MHGNCQQTDHLQRQYVLLLLAIWGCSGTATCHNLTCLPTSASAPRPVLGFWESLQKGNIGCTSRGRSALGQEVHIISLQKGIVANGQVTLITLDPDPLARAPIFVLYSQEPVRWVLLSPPGKNWTFQVSPGSNVSALGPVASAETNLPGTPKALLKWARRKHGGVTSLVEYHGVNRIYTRLGAGLANEDRIAPAACRLRRNFLTPVHFASKCRLRPLRVCLCPDPPQDLEVHIILSKGVAPSLLSSRPSLAHLTVELHAVRRPPHWGVILILKSEGAAEWTVRAHRLTGRLHVLASHKVTVSSTEMDLPLTVTQRTSPRLMALDPLQFAAEQNLPAFMSYVEAERVNRFLLFVGMNGATPSPLEEPTLFWPLFLPPPSFTASQQHFAKASTAGREVRRQDLGGEGSSATHPPSTAKTEATESILCLGDQKPTLENQDTHRVSCVSPSPTQVSPSEAAIAFQDLHLGNALLNLELYNTEAFAKQLGPFVVSANSVVFVEASLANYDSSLGFTIQQCFISSSSDASEAPVYLLVQHGCPVATAQVKMWKPELPGRGEALPQGYQERQRLSFVLKPRSNSSIHFLHCRLTLCSRGSQNLARLEGLIPKCQSENEACSGEEKDVQSRFQRTITKPMLMTVETPLQAAAPVLKPASFPNKQQGKASKDATHKRKTKIVRTATPPGLTLPAVIGIAIAAFLIGISLTIGLWFIHTYTGESASGRRSQPAAETGPSAPKPGGTSSAPTAAGRVHGKWCRTLRSLY